MVFCTRIRLVQTQVWPLLRYFEISAPCTAASISASSKTINGALPPNSMEVRLSVAAQACSNRRPTSVEPVKVSFRTKGLSVSAGPISEEAPTTTFRTPAGTPARSASSAMASADRGVSDAGLITMLHPAARAGAALRAIMALGKFHGVIAATTPIGCLIHTTRLSLEGAGITSPSIRLACSPNHSMKAAP